MLKILTKKWFWYLIILPLTITVGFYYSLYTAYKYVETRDKEIFQAGYEVGRYDQLVEDDATSKQEISLKLKTSKENLLKELAKIESVNGKYRKILDTNNKYSLGLYHFQASTVVDMYKRYYKTKITIEDGVRIAQDDELATKLAYDAIFVKGETYHWHNSMIKLSKKGLIAYGK